MPSLNTGNAILSNPIKVDSSYNVGIGGAASGSFKLQVTGTGNFTGALSGTSATFSGNLEVFSGSAGVTVGDFLVNPTTKYVYVGRQSSTSGDNTTFVVRDRTGSARATIPGGGSIDTVFSTNNSNFIVSNYSGTSLMTIANTGAATFSSSVTAQTGEFNSAGQEGALGSVVRISTTNTNGNARNWAIVNTWDNYGDITFRVSNAQGGNALSAGTNVFSLLRTGAALFSSSVTAGSEFISYTGISMDAGGGTIRGGLTLNYSTGEFKSFCGVAGNSYFQTFNTNGIEAMRILNNGIALIYSVYSQTSGAAANVIVGSDGNLFRSTSSLKYKKNVENYNKGLAEVMQLRAVTYNGINELDGDKEYAGLIAEEVHELGLTEFVQYAEDGSPDALSYSNMVSLLVKAIQEQQAQIEELKALINK